MNGYLAILKMRMKTLLQYRTAAFAAVTTEFFWGLIMMMIYQAFFSSTTAKEPLSLSQSITFLWLGQALIQLLPWTIDKELEAQIKNGNVAYELVRPVDLYAIWFARALALRLIPTLMRCFPILILAGLFFGLEPPVSGQAGALFAISIILALFLSSAISTLVMVSLFWTISGEGIQRLLPNISLLLSGLMVPLPLFPHWLQPFLSIQPFRGVLDIPCRIYTGVIPIDTAFYFLGFQLAWICCFVWFGHKLMKKAARHFVIQGG